MSAEPSPEGSLEARALWFTAPRTAEFRPEPVPPPEPGEVRVRTMVSAISHGTEMLVYRGEVPVDLPLDLPTLAGDYAFPIKYGYASVGRVLDANVEHLSPGDLVFVHHPHQDAFVVPADLPVRLPEGIDPTTGLFFANLETALNVVHDTPLRLGETALVFGQGVVGLLVTQLLKLAGAGKVLAVEPLKKRRELALDVGADETFEPDGDLRGRILAATAGRGADVAVEVSSSGAALQAAVDAVATEGTVVVASWYGTKPVTLSLGGHFHRGRVRLRSSQVGRMNPEIGTRWDTARRTQTVLSLLPRLRLKEIVSHQIPFEDAPAAFRLVDENPGEAVQVVLIHDRH
ncbi:MAG: zinc-binding alcohol dehydrogenase [Actinomycetota bacterium]|nr:zinc-binding alcohol dehydrogenase [Actinomycetota bacterium]